MRERTDGVSQKNRDLVLCAPQHEVLRIQANQIVRSDARLLQHLSSPLTLPVFVRHILVIQEIHVQNTNLEHCLIRRGTGLQHTKVEGQHLRVQDVLIVEGISEHMRVRSRPAHVDAETCKHPFCYPGILAPDIRRAKTLKHIEDIVRREIVGTIPGVHVFPRDSHLQVEGLHKLLD